MGQNPRRPGFRLRWGETERADEAAAADATADQDVAPHATAVDAVAEPVGAAAEPASETVAPAEGAEAAQPDAAQPAPAEVPFLRDLVGAMRGVAESSRDSSLESVRKAVEDRVAELTASAGEKAEELRRTADTDANAIGDWERTELERVRREAEQRRDARRAELEKQLADHQAATDAEVEETRNRLVDHERELDAFFAQLSEITDPSAFVAAAKRMPPPPDLTKTVASKPAKAAAQAESPAAGEKSATNGSASSPSDETLAQRLAQLDRRLAQAAPAEAAAASTEVAAPEVPASEAAAAVAPASETPARAEPEPPVTPAPVAGGSGAATAVETSTAIVVKGLGSFGAITSFKQALERVEGVRGVTLSLGPTGDFVYRASHAADFDILAAIRSIEGPSAGIEQSEGSLVVTIAGPR